MSGGLVNPKGISTGTYLGISLVETLIREQQRQAYLQQQLRTQQELGRDQAPTLPRHFRDPRHLRDTSETALPTGSAIRPPTPESPRGSQRLWPRGSE